MSMKPGQILREGLPNAAFEPFRDLRDVRSQVLPPLEPAYDVLRESKNAFVARAEPLD